MFYFLSIYFISHFVRTYVNYDKWCYIFVLRYVAVYSALSKWEYIAFGLLILLTSGNTLYPIPFLGGFFKPFPFYFLYFNIIYPHFPRALNTTILLLLDIVILVLESQLLLAKQVALLDPLRDLAANESDTTFLSPEYK